MRKTRIYLVDDNSAIRMGLKLLINGQPDLEVCGDAESSPGALEQIQSLLPDLAIVDLTLKEKNGLQLTGQLRRTYPALKILIFSMHETESLLQAAFQAGANGYVTKDQGSEELIEAVRRLMQGQAYLGTTLAARLTADCAWWKTANQPTQTKSCRHP